MENNILVISVSPRKNGNSGILFDAFADGAREAGNDVKIHIAEVRKFGNGSQRYGIVN